MGFPAGLAMLRNHCLLALLGSSRTTTSHTLLQGASPQSSCSRFTDEGTEARGRTCSPDHTAGSWLAELVPRPPGVQAGSCVPIPPSTESEETRGGPSVRFSCRGPTRKGPPQAPGAYLSILSGSRSRAGHSRGQRIQAVCNADRAKTSELSRHGRVCGIQGLPARRAGLRASDGGCVGPSPCREPTGCPLPRSDIRPVTQRP